MKKVILLVTLLQFILTNLSTAQTKLYAEIGYGGYDMPGMIDFQNGLKDQIPVNARTVEEYPDFMNLSLYSRITLDSVFSIGPFIRYQSTGGRVSYKDFSGSITLDNNISAFALGATSEMILQRKKMSYLALNLNAGVFFTQDKFEYKTLIYDEQESTSLVFNSTNFFLEPGVNYNLQLIHPLNIFVAAGYCIDIGANLSPSGNRRAILANSEGQNVKSSWTGYRFGVGLMITIPEF